MLMSQGGVRNEELLGTNYIRVQERISKVCELLGSKNDIVVGTTTILLLCRPRMNEESVIRHRQWGNCRFGLVRESTP